MCYGGYTFFMSAAALGGHEKLGPPAGRLCWAARRPQLFESPWQAATGRPEACSCVYGGGPKKRHVSCPLSSLPLSFSFASLLATRAGKHIAGVWTQPKADKICTQPACQRLRAHFQEMERQKLCLLQLDSQTAGGNEICKSTVQGVPV